MHKNSSIILLQGQGSAQNRSVIKVFSDQMSTCSESNAVVILKQELAWRLKQKGKGGGEINQERKPKTYCKESPS